jgi:hypothetical protein
MHLLAATVTSTTHYLTSIVPLLLYCGGILTARPTCMEGTNQCMNEIKAAGHYQDLMRIGRH